LKAVEFVKINILKKEKSNSNEKVSLLFPLPSIEIV
jgi:hypothetical protein